MKTIKVVQLHNGKQQEITIEFNNGFYKIDSSDNLIVCTDCNKLISIHSKCCINCGCDLTYVIRHTYEVENQTQQKIFDSIKQQKEALITEIKDLCAVLKIKRYENCNLNNSVEDLMQIKSELYNKKLLLDRRKQIFSNIPVFCKKALENKGIYLYQLDNDVVEEIYEKSLQYDSVSMERLAIVKKRAYSLFVSALKKYYPNYTQDNKLLFKKYMEFISRDRIAYNKDDEFFLKLKNIFSKKADTYHKKMQDDDFTDIGDYEIYFAFAILKGKWKRDDIFYNYVALYLFKDYYVEKEFERFQVYVENTLKKLYNSILYRIESEYKEKIENEIKVYKKSPTYWENREKYIREKRKQKKSSNIYDGLNDELKKLEYWSPNLFASETHISYHTKATNQDASPSADWPDVYGFGFQASVSLQEYICGYASSYNDIKVSAFSNYFLQLMTEGCSRWKRLDTFASILLNWYIENGFRIFSIIREIREIFNLESDIGKMFFFSKEDCVLTNMQVKIKNIESKVEKQIVTNYSEDSFIYLGRLLGETFYNPVDNEKYTVIEIKS